MSARSILKLIVESASKPEPSASRKLAPVVTVPDYIMETGRAILRGPTPEGKSYLRKLMRNTFYGPNHATSLKWTVCARKIVADEVLVLLCANGGDHCVFTFWIPRLTPKTYPSDKFTYGAQSGLRLYREICAREAKEYA